MRRLQVEHSLRFDLQYVVSLILNMLGRKVR